MNERAGENTTRLTDQDLVPVSGVPERAGLPGYRLAAGTPLGPYKVLGPIGVGGMGEVYGARDPALKRDVAIKILPRDLAADPDRLARFRREAQVLASLNHPNVAAVYGLHDAGDNMLALVMELVEGQTLAERIARGRLPVREVIAVGRQIAEALASAHEQGIVHRDLKPANIKIRPDDQVKVLDFGLAKALDPRTGVGSGDRADGAGSGEYMTATGIVVGTGPYMAPEQVRGKGVDRRADIWAFGVVCWEMLTGSRPFEGETLSDVLGAVLHNEPDWSQLPPKTPPILRRLLRRCLEKNPRLRLDSATSVRLDLQEALDGNDTGNVRPTRPWIPWAVAGVATAAAALLMLSNSATEQTPATHSAILKTELGADITLRDDPGSAIALSPDGGTLVFVSAQTSVPSMLYVRRMDELDARPLEGTQNARSPFFSPDGQWIGFFADKKLRRISASGGPALDICAAEDARGGSWSDDGKWIVFAPEKTKGLLKVAATGGVPEPLTKVVSGEVTHRWPQVLPGSRHVLYTSSTKTDEWNDARLMVQALAGGEPKVLQPGFYGRFVASGHLLFVQNATISAAPFDPQTLEPPGRSATVVDNIAADPSTGGAQYSVADDGTLVFLQGRKSTKAVSVVSMARSGSIGTLHDAPLDWTNPQVSPKGDRLAFDVHDGANRNIWILDLKSRQKSQLTFDAGDNYKPIWTPDGTRVVFTSTRNRAANLYWQPVDGAGPAQRLTTSANLQNAGSWDPSGAFLAYEEWRPGTGKDIFILPFDKATLTPTKPILFVGEPDNQAEPVFSPDGRWVAFHGSTPTRTEVFVRSFKGEGRWQISSGGGRDAAWFPTPAGGELVYFSTGDERIMTARYSVLGNSFRHEQPVPWSVIRFGRPPRDGRTFHLHPNGEHVVGVPRSPMQMTIMFDLFGRLRRLVPGAE